jgi:hypothetical protein
MFAGRSLDTKHALYKAIVKNLSEIGVPATEIKTILVDVPAENWGLRGGLPASEIDPLSYPMSAALDRPAGEMFGSFARFEYALAAYELNDRTDACGLVIAFLFQKMAQGGRHPPSLGASSTAGQGRVRPRDQIAQPRRAPP